MKLGIIAIGYNRRDCMERLLTRLNNCVYENERPLLIISVDKAKDSNVEQYARKFVWRHGEKIVKTFSERQGLQKHIFKCGNYMEEYKLDAVAVFEDDVFPSIDFYHFMKQAVEFYINNYNIAGISLYTHRWNPIANKPFIPLDNGHDVYFSYFACSWGQIWLRRQWNDFVKWCEINADSKCLNANIPSEVKQWKNSWLKYHIAYCTCEKKYFVYPYKAFSTCFSEEGAHTRSLTSTYQVPIVTGYGGNYNFINPECGRTLYDSFFESVDLELAMKDRGWDTCVDLYGLKGCPQNERYWLSLESHPYEIVKKYGLLMKPHEQNIMNDIPGSEIFLYDVQKKNDRTEKLAFSFNKYMYYFNGSVDKRLLVYILKQKIKNRLRSILI